MPIFNRIGRIFLLIRLLEGKEDFLRQKWPIIY